jgi:IS5 family transposase
MMAFQCGEKLVPAPPQHRDASTKNAVGERDPEMHQTKKGNQWHFGMKIHVGPQRQVTAANQADISELPNLLPAARG